MTGTPRARALERLQGGVASGRALLAAGVGSGLAASSAAEGGSDLIVALNSGRFRTAGHGSLSGLLPFGDANAIVLDLVREVLAVVDDVPVVAGVCGTDPTRDMERLVHELRALGVSGILNFPTTGLYGEAFRDDLEATGISFEREVELMRVARRAGLLTCAFVVDRDGARRMALAGVDVLAPHLGVTRHGDGASALRTAAARIAEIADAGRSVRDDLVVLFHGGPAVDAADVQQVLEAAPGIHGFFAASSVERLPVRAAIRAAVESFTEIRLHPGDAHDSAPAPDFDEPPPALPIELSTETLAPYLKRVGIVDADERVEVEELGGGLSNVILRWRTAGGSGVVKQSRPRLRVEDEWLSDVRRVLNERDAIALLGARLEGASIPTLTFSDDEMLAFGMVSAPDDAVLWKPELLAGRYDVDRARQAGALLRSLHDVTRDDPVVARRFVARPLLDQNRLDPWYRAAATAHEDLRDVFEYAIERLLSEKHVLVHGDFVPKNIFLLPEGLLLLDYEVAHFGNPGYDVATFVNHMLLKGFREPGSRAPFRRLAGAFLETYLDGLELAELERVTDESIIQLGALMLARVDGKSKVEYLVGSPGADEARAFGRWLLRSRPASFREVFDRYTAGLTENEEVRIQ